MRRTVRLAIAGSLGSAALLLVLEPGHEEPLRLIVALLPLLVAGFAALRDGRPRAAPPGLRLGMLSAVAVWGVLAVGWRHLALQRAEPVVVAAGVLLLAGWLALELPRLLRRLACTRSALPPRVFFLLPLLVYIAVLPWVESRHVPNGDEPYYLLLAHSLAQDRDVDLANNYANNEALAFMSRPIEPQPGDPTGEDGEIYSRHSPALPALLALPYLVAGRTGAALVMLLFAAGVAWSGLALSRALWPGRHRGQLLAWVALAFGSPLVSYSYRFWAEVPAALGLTVAALLILRLRAGRTLGAGQLAVLALSAVWPIMVKARFALVAAPLAALAWWRTGRRWKPALVIGIGLLAAGAAVVLLHLAHYERWLGKYAISALDLRRFPVGNWPRGLAGFLLDSAFGLAAACPIWLLVLPALVLTLRRNPASRGLLLVWMPYFFVLLPRGNAFSQFAPPFRYALAVLPLLAACLVPVLEDRRALVRTVTHALAGLTLALTVVWIAQPEWTVNRVTGTTHLIDRLQLLTHSDFGRLFPSYLRVRAAAWVWAGVALLLAACWKWWPGRPRIRGLAAPLVLLALASFASSASRAPTRTVEFEDTWVEKRGGAEYPEPWKPWAQPRAWELAPGESVRVPVVSGGPILQPSLRLRSLDAAHRRVAFELFDESGRVLETWTGELDSERLWEWKSLPAIPLPRQGPFWLGFRVVEPPPPESESGSIALDRARFDWMKR